MIELRPDRNLAGPGLAAVYLRLHPAGRHRLRCSAFLVLFLYLNFLWLVGEGLEQAWGSFRLNLYYFIGMLGTTVAAFFLGAGDVKGFYLNLSLFFAFATLFPIIRSCCSCSSLPVRVKWVALFALGPVFLQMIGGGITEHVAIIVSLANYLIFFGPVW